MTAGNYLRVLLVASDAALARVIRSSFKRHGIELEWVRAGIQAIRSLSTGHYDAMILDPALPDIDGFDLCRDLRGLGKRIPICMLTACATLEDKLKGFEVGADDYLTQPFQVDELLARVRVMARRNQRDQDQSRVAFGPLLIDVLAREAHIGERALELTRREFDVLTYLARNAQQVVSREQLLQIVWGSEREVTLNTLDVYVGYLRRKLRGHADAPRIKTVRGIGFKLC